MFAPNNSAAASASVCDGSAVPTAVNVVVSGIQASFRTWSTSGKAKRLRRDMRVLALQRSGASQPDLRSPRPPAC